MRESEDLLDALESGELRVAEQSDEGVWTLNVDVKKRILQLFRESEVIAQGLETVSPSDESSLFWDKAPLRVRRFRAEDGVRCVPGGSSVRRGVHLAKGVILMPPMYANIGAYIDTGTMIDSHALVGSCAQIGKRVHLSAAAQIGGVLEPPTARPVIVEDDAFIGGGCGLYDGVLVHRRAVLAAGVILTGTSRVYDVVREMEYRGTPQSPLEIPESAVVVPGSRPSENSWAKSQGLHVQCSLIVKYRDERTDQNTALEDALR